MNRALLADLQQRRCYPSVTVLLNTDAGTVMDREELATAHRLVDHVDRRLTGDVDDDLRVAIVSRLRLMIAEHADERCTHALALCASPEHDAVVRLGRRVAERVVVDDTFATRDVVADLNRTAMFRVITVSDRVVRVLVGDRVRLVEERDGGWPMVRAPEQRAEAWGRSIVARLTELHSADPLPTVVAGVARTIRHAVAKTPIDRIGTVTGNHDRTGWIDLHAAAWPIVSDWLRTDGRRALAALDDARSSCRFAGGIDEIWPLANEGRVETLVVEDGYAVAARVERDLVIRADDPEAPDVVDDIVDETIEAVLRHAGRAVMVGDGLLEPYGHIAAVLRY